MAHGLDIIERMFLKLRMLVSTGLGFRAMAIQELHVAARVVALQHERGNKIGKLQLQKLLYLVDALAGHLSAEKTFAQLPIAMERGPCYSTVLDAYKKVPGIDPIPAPIGKQTRVLDEAINAILDRFGGWSGEELEEYVKGPGAPWHDTPMRSNIDPAATMRYFAKRSLLPGDHLSEQQCAALDNGDFETFAKSLG